LDRTSFRNLLNKFGLQRPTATVTPEKMRDTFIRNNYQLAKTAKELNVSEDFLRSRLRAMDVKRPHQAITPELLKETWYSHRYNMETTAKVLKVNRSTIAKLLKEFGIKKPWEDVEMPPVPTTDEIS
jgi:DNA-binding NtrC family response regulator